MSAPRSLPPLGRSPSIVDAGFHPDSNSKVEDSPTRHAPCRRRSFDGFVVTEQQDSRPRFVVTNCSNPIMKPEARIVHPRGFRLLSSRSPIERNIRSYFRVRPRLPPHVQKEHEQLHRRIRLQEQPIPERTISRLYYGTGRLSPAREIHGTPPYLQKGASSLSGPRQLDGYVILAAAQVDDPAEVQEVVVEGANLVGVVREHLSYFTALEYLNVSENNVPMSELAALPRLVELHIPCNALQMTDLVPSGISSGPAPLFLHLKTLNLGYNGLNIAETLLLLTTIAPVLEQLDLSGNRGPLGSDKFVSKNVIFPSDLSTSSQLRQLALEHCGIVDACQIWPSLGTLPMLQEVNLNHNKLRHIPYIQGMTPTDTETTAGSHTTVRRSLFPKIAVLGLAANQFEDVDHLVNLQQWRQTLRRVVLWGNPFNESKRERTLVESVLRGSEISPVFHGPIPPKRSASYFCGHTAASSSIYRISNPSILHASTTTGLRQYYRRNADQLLNRNAQEETTGLDSLFRAAQNSPPEVCSASRDDSSGPRSSSVLSSVHGEEGQQARTCRKSPLPQVGPSFFLTQGLNEAEAHLQGNDIPMRSHHEVKSIGREKDSKSGSSEYNTALRKADAINQGLLALHSVHDSPWGLEKVANSDAERVHVAAGLRAMPIHAAYKELRQMLSKPLLGNRTIPLLQSMRP